MSDTNALIARCYSDLDFQTRLLADPEGTLRNENYSYDQELLDAIQKVADDKAAVSTLEDAEKTFTDTKSSSGTST